MVHNVFGNPITDETLKAMPEYKGKTITRRDRAHVALHNKNAGGKQKKALEYVENLKKEWGTGVSTLCLIYNATGDKIHFDSECNWHGHIGPAPYPTEIANGQWGGFLHVKTSGAATGSSAAVLYSCRNNDGKHFYWMFAWSNPWNRSSWDNAVCTEIIDSLHAIQGYWDNIYEKLQTSGLSASWNYYGFKSNVKTGSDTSPILEAIITLDGA